MEMNELIVLSRKYLSGKASDAEKAALLHWYNAYDESELLVKIMAAPDETEEELEARMLQRLQLATGTAPVRRIHFLRRKATWAAAAAVLLLAAVTVWWWPARKPAAIAAATRITSGSKAVLILGDGSQVQLDSAASGVLTQQGNTRVMQSAGGLSYQAGNNSGSTALMNTLRTPRGVQSRVTLPDGTGVWLNAASSVTYPVAFNGKEREVRITGEAYFEVTSSANQPFVVKTATMDVLVLGTHFNISAYEDENSANTTLLEGAVAVRTGEQAQHILPGQQISVANGKIGPKKRVDVTAVMAWKNGYFSFRDADVPAVMRELSRWYDAEVHYENGIPEGNFTGEIGRGLTLEQVAALLETTRIHLKISNGGKHITVLP
ncbi:FecR family protein [Chitinophaga solisilvae]|uniref:FecR family protein n=1 Tax=Chitinophaga solisilvae TaxID=1233460 RepID=UPI00136A7BDE|nr:FecR family protein [Chitinophaga solisilvae]